MATDTHPNKPTMDMDTNSLFEKMTIAEIRDTEKKIRQDIEKKKEDLRVMVGERYRDLIEAADTIKDMKTSSENVTKSIGHMEDMCKTLKQDYMVKGVSYHQKSKTEVAGRKKQESEFYGVAAQIKLLLDMPEKIWSSNDDRDYLTATRLYLLARHVNTSLQLNSQRSANVLSWFPVLTRQWAAISHFKNTILQGCRNSLQEAEETYSDKQIAKFLCSILLLEDSTPRQVFNDFLLARTKAIQQALHPSQHANVRDQVAAVVRLLTTTVHQIHAVFYNTQDQAEKQKAGQCNLLSETLENVLNKSEEKGLLSLQGSISAKCLPKSVKDFRPVLRSAGSTVSSQHIQDNCHQWINTCINDMQTGVGKLLGFVNSVKRLADIRDSVWELLSQEGGESQWDVVCQRVVNKTLRVWGDFLQPLFVDRVKQLIQFQLDTTAELTKRNVAKVVQDLAPETADSSHQSELDLACFLWTESSGDIAANSIWTPSANKTLVDGGGLILKARAFTPAVQSLCRNIDDKMKALLEDNRPYLQPEGEEGGTARAGKEGAQSGGPFNRYGDTVLLLNYVQAACTKSIREVVDYLTEQLKLWQKSFEIPDPTINMLTENKILVVGRLCAALPELAPHLQQCVLGPAHGQNTDMTRSIKKSKLSSKQPDHPEWANLREKLEQCKLQAYKSWVDHCTSVTVSEFSQALHAENVSTVIQTSTRWEDVTIQEESDEGQKHSSKIHVPMQPSWYLQSLLFRLCQDLNKIGGQALPRSVVQDLIQRVTEGIISTYQEYIKGGKRKVRKSGLPLTQQQALQSLFDVRYLVMMIPRKDETYASKTFQKKAESVCNSLEEVVDPFDLDVFSPYMQANLLRQCQRSAVIFGSLAALDKQSVISGGRAHTPGQQEQHNVLPLSTCPNRFPLLPLSTQQNRSSLQNPVLSQTIARGLDSGGQSLTLAVEAVLPKSNSQTDLSSSLYDKLGSMGSRFLSKLQDK